jgi:hypothetical protein
MEHIFKRFNMPNINIYLIGSPYTLSLSEMSEKVSFSNQMDLHPAKLTRKHKTFPF